MALAESVTGAGKAISGSTESGSYTETIVRNDGSKRLLTVFFTAVRSELKWYALTKAAIDTYIAANPTYNVTYSLNNENSPIQGYEMTVQSVTRTITGVQITTPPDVE